MSKRIKSGQVVKINVTTITKDYVTLMIELPGNTQVYINTEHYFRYKKWVTLPQTGIVLNKIEQERLFIKAFDEDEKGRLAILTNNDMIISPSSWRNLLTSTFYEVLCGDMKIILTRNDFKKI